MPILVMVKTWELIYDALYWEQAYEDWEEEKMGKYGY